MELCREHRARLRCLAGRETRSTCTRNRGQRDGQRCVTARAVTEFLEWCATPLPNLSPPIMYTALELCCPLKTAAWNFEDEKIYAKKEISPMIGGRYARNRLTDLPTNSCTRESKIDETRILLGEESE